MPTHVPSQIQWWSNFITQLLQTLQCEALTGLKIKHVSQNLNLNINGECVKFTCRKKTRASRDTSRYLSGRPGWIACQLRDGTIPGSLDAVCSIKKSVATNRYINRMIATFQATPWSQ